MKKILSLFIVLALIITMTGCGTAPQPEINSGTPQTSSTPTVTAAPEKTPELPFTVTDSRGVEVTFEKYPEKVISLMPSNTEILYALDSQERIIAVSEYCNYPEDTASKQKLPTGEKMSIENLIALKPDAAFIGKMSIMDDQIKQLEDAGVKVIVTEANSLSDTYKVTALIGKVMGKDEEAASLIEKMQSGFDEIKEAVKGKAPQTVYVEVSPLQYGLWSCGKNTFIQELIDIIGAKNIFADVEGWAAVSEEQVLAHNPNVILTTASPLTGIEDPVGEITSRANWGSLDAVKNKRVLMLDGDMISRPGPRLLDSAKELVKAVYPN